MVKENHTSLHSFKHHQGFSMFLSSCFISRKYFLKPPFLPSKFRCPLNPDSQAPTPSGSLPWLPLPSPSQPRPLSKLLPHGTVSIFTHHQTQRSSGEELWSSVFCTPGQEWLYVAMLWRGLLNLITWHEIIMSEFPRWTSRLKPKKQLSLSSGRNRLSWVNQSEEQRQQLCSALLYPAASTSLTQVSGTLSWGYS